MFLEAHKRPELLRNPCPLGGPERQAGGGGSDCLTPAFSGAQKRADLYVTPELLGVPNAKRRGKSTSGHITPAFSGSQKGAELLCNRSILGGPQRQVLGENQKWLPHPCLLRGPEEGGIAM